MSDIKTIPGFWNGISQQAPAMRKENQAARQINAYGTLVNGLEKRHGSNHLATLGTLSSAAAYADCLSWVLDLGASGVFVVLATEDSDDPIQAYTLAGVKKTINYETVGEWSAKDYFAGSGAANRRYRAVIVGNTMVLLNTEKVTSVDATVPTITTKAIASYDASTDVVTVTAHGYSDGDRIQYQNGSSALIAPLVNNGSYYVKDKTDNTFKLSLSSGGATIDITGSGGGGQFRTGSILAGVVQTFAELPVSTDVPPIAAGDVYKIQGSDTSTSKWYVKWSGSVWEEHYNVEEASGAPDGKTMPMALTYNSGTGQFTLARQTYPGREAGDSVTNPVPSFAGKSITNVFFHRGRLGLISGSNIIFSAVGASRYTTFYPDSVVDTLDDDPIDIAVSADNLDTLRSTLSMEQSLIVFADKTQFNIHSGDSAILSTTTIAADPTTRFEIEPYHQPYAAGSNALFLCETPSFLTMREYFVSSDSLSADAADITIHVPRLIPAGDGQITGINVLDVAFVRTSASPQTIFVYKYYWVNDDKIQSAWSEWTFDGSVLTMAAYGKSLFLIIQRGDEVSMETIDVEGDIDADLNIHVHMDRKVTLVDGEDVTYDDQTDLTSFVLPYEPLDADEVNLICPATAVIIHAEDLTQDESNPKLFTIQGDQTGEDWTAGATYPMEYELSQFYLRNDKGVAVQGGRLALRRLWLEYEDTGYFFVSVAAQGRDERVDIVVSIEGNFDVITNYDAMNTISGADKFPIFLNSKVAIVTLKNPTLLPCKIVAGSWEYLFTARTRPTG